MSSILNPTWTVGIPFAGTLATITSGRIAEEELAWTG
jgi:hypothetical protein